MDKKIEFISLKPSPKHRYIFCMNFVNAIINVPFDDFTISKSDVGVWRLKKSLI